MMKRILSLLALLLLTLYLVTWTRLSVLHYYDSQRQWSDVDTATIILSSTSQRMAADNVLLERNSLINKSPSLKSHHKNRLYEEFTNTTSRQKMTKPITIQQKEKLQMKMDRMFESSEVKPSNLWEISDYIPLWMKEYMTWHQQQRKQLTDQSWSNHKFLILQCIDYQDTIEQCGTLTQRLLILPVALKMAYQTKRILFIHWTLPTRIIEFLLPPEGGIDWRTPIWLKKVLEDRNQGPLIDNVERLLSMQTLDDPLIRLRILSDTDVASVYNNNNIQGHDDSKFEEIFHDMWRIFFTPSKHIQKQIINLVRSNQDILPGQYISVDLIKSKNDEKTTPTNDVTAIKCASQLQPFSPALVTSNDVHVLEDSVNIGQEHSEANIITPKTIKYDRNRKPILETFHTSIMDFDKESDRKTPEDYYDTFLNLYLLAMSTGIISYQSTDLSYLGSLIGYNSTNFVTPSTACSWPTISNVNATSSSLKKKITSKSNIHQFAVPMLGEGSDFTFNDNLQHKKDCLPDWMERYFLWHNKTKRNLTPNNWKSTKYLILGCFESHSHCGGISDRLKPLPMVLLEAQKSRRLLLIWWERPKPLEDFLIPPIDNGVDWTVPTWLKDELKKESGIVSMRNTVNNFDQGKMLFRGNPNQLAIIYKIQTPSSGEFAFYDEQLKEPKKYPHASTYREVFHILFRRFFTPVPRITNLLDNKMKDHGMIPGHYVTAHLRAMYGKRSHRDQKEMIEIAVLGVNCASNLFPGKPIYFASDTAAAVESVKTYSKMHHLPIVTFDFQETYSQSGDPIHLDKDDDWKSRNASAYDSTFLDLLMLAQSRCVAYSNGGYGKFGSLLSFDSDCNVQFFRVRDPALRCSWMSANRTLHDLTFPTI